MIYKAVIKEVYKCPCGYEGDILLEINGEKKRFYYQANENFADSFLKIEKNIDADIVAVYGNVEKAEDSENICCEMQTDNIKLCGKIIGRRGKSNFYSINCEKMIIEIEDCDRKIEKADFKSGDIIKYSGSLKVYFPGTEYSFEEIEG